MSIEYAIIRKDGVQVSLNGSGISNQILARSITYTADSFSVDTRVVENSYLPGSNQIGVQRNTSRSLPFRASVASADTSDFRLAVNTVLDTLNRADYIVDVTNGLRMKVVLEEASVDYDTGSLKHSADISFSMLALTPFWEDNTVQTESASLTAGVISNVAVNNDGFYEVPPVFSVSVSGPSAYVDIQIGAQSLRVEDTIFGTSGNFTMTIDNVRGIVTIGQFNRTTSIVEGLGFISIPVGNSSIAFICDVDASLLITYRRRYYV